MRDEREARYYDLEQIPAWKFSWVNYGGDTDIEAYKVCKD